MEEIDEEDSENLKYININGERLDLDTDIDTLHEKIR